MHTYTHAYIWWKKNGYRNRPTCAIPKWLLWSQKSFFVSIHLSSSDLDPNVDHIHNQNWRVSEWSYVNSWYWLQFYESMRWLSSESKNCMVFVQIKFDTFSMHLALLSFDWLHNMWPVKGLQCQTLQKGVKLNLVLVGTLDIGCDQLPNILSYINKIVLALMQESWLSVVWEECECQRKHLGPYSACVRIPAPCVQF